MAYYCDTGIESMNAVGALTVGHDGANQFFESEISDEERDSLHILPLCIVPIETPGIRRARMIKNSSLISVIELFHDDDTGSGQVDVGAIVDLFGLPERPPHPDLVLLRQLALMPSYDVYSLRILLREKGIVVSDLDGLKLSAKKVHELTGYMTKFTHPLISEIYGQDDVAIKSFDDVVKLFLNPNVAVARQKLQIMAEKLGLELLEIPKFLEDYGDIFLSLSYYRECLDQISPAIDEILNSITDIRANMQLKHNGVLMRICAEIEATINEATAAVTGRFENFDRSTGDMWRDISAERFRAIEKAIKRYHVTIGGVLCSLTVIVGAWKHSFPTVNSGGPIRRSEFLMTTMRQGISNIQKIDDSAPMLSGSDFA